MRRPGPEAVPAVRAPRAAGHAAHAMEQPDRRTPPPACASRVQPTLSDRLTAPKRLALGMFRILLFTMSNTKVIRFGT
ncbi:hypothetical protein METUNv1_03270 [Methyloversatilis universalis FAM5]|uniref:Uncharacterized protein n=1 Tax=Methyloversatilis universalis (strain ATCC BAA-1314 / DSM 25237 / JCM 13912 / CCUG 52030 / FAM5) TaxID=1000565 RepID=F5RGH3_METUF|nr:hypothetical protein METUNv1_03270 [Methyloversatilis universalis FAM5]